MYFKINPQDFYVTGCTHFFHKNIVRGVSDWKEGWRNFDSVDQMNTLLLENINKIVPADGHLLILGDMMFGDKDKLPSILNRIVCKNIYYVYGNHSSWLRKRPEYQRLFKWVGDYLEIFAGKQLVCVSHYPMIVWNESHKKSWMLHSHCHASLKDNPNAKRIDCGMDAEFLDWGGNIRMTRSYNEEPQENGTYKVLDTDDPLCKIIHHRFHPFSYQEIEKIMSYKETKQIDHHNKQCRQ